MISGGREYTFFLAYVEEDTPWDVSLARFDENIFDMQVDHDEGQIPTVILEIANPRIGILNPSRLYWVWLSYSVDDCGPMPLMFGRIVGIPEEQENNTIRLQLITRDTDYQYQKQQVARTLKVLPNYDPIFFKLEKRDDPDAIIEGWDVLYHVDRVNGRVSASNVISGEDGTINFAARDVFYDSLKYRTLQSPLKAINVKMEVNWEQQFRGYIYMGQWAYPTLGGDAFIGDWPKSGANLGGGWSSGVAWAGQRDPTIVEERLLTQKPFQMSMTYNWTSNAKEHRTGDTMSISINYTEPFGQSVILRSSNQIGMINPNAVDMNGDPAPINRPAKQSIDWFCYRTFALNFLGRQSLATLGLVYVADRKRSERLETTIKADVQAVLTDPDVIEDTEQITLQSGDLSLPLIELTNWDSVGRGGSVEVGQLIFPSNPLVPGQTSSQIALQAGVTGDEIPTFSNIAGQVTFDGTVIWASLGNTQPSEASQDWIKFARVPLGTLIVPKPISGVPDFESVQFAGKLNYPPSGVAVARYSIYSIGNSGPGSAMTECTNPGMLGGISSGVHASFHAFTNPSGKFMYIAVQAGTTGEFHTTFDETVGGLTSDGSVIWQNVGEIILPIGGWAGQTPAAAFFTTDRGKLSILHGYCRARAKLRKRARAVEVKFDTRFEVAAQLSCRMNGRVTDPRLPGGTAWGKVIGYKLKANGDTGIVQGSVTLGCPIGTVATHEEHDYTEEGVPCYAAEGYMARGYQRYYSSRTLLTPGDPDFRSARTAAQEGVSFLKPTTPPDWPDTPPTVWPDTCAPLYSTWSPGAPVAIEGDEFGYTPPMYEAIDDGIIFPASKNDLVLRSEWHGLASTINQLNIDLYNLQLGQIIHNAIGQANKTKQVNFGGIGGSASGSITVETSPWYDIQVAVETAVIQAMLQGTGLWYELVLKPLTNGPFIGAYVVETIPMLIEQGTNLSAESTL